MLLLQLLHLLTLKQDGLQRSPVRLFSRCCRLPPGGAAALLSWRLARRPIGRRPLLCSRVLLLLRLLLLRPLLLAGTCCGGIGIWTVVVGYYAVLTFTAAARHSQQLLCTCVKGGAGALQTCTVGGIHALHAAGGRLELADAACRIKLRAEKKTSFTHQTEG